MEIMSAGFFALIPTLSRPTGGQYIMVTVNFFWVKDILYTIHTHIEYMYYMSLESPYLETHHAIYTICSVCKCMFVL